MRRRKNPALRHDPATVRMHTPTLPGDQARFSGRCHIARPFMAAWVSFQQPPSSFSRL